MKYAHKRSTFGKKLIEHPVIRLKLAHMARQIEATQAWLDNLVYQAQNMDDTEAMLKLGGAIAACKLQSTLTFEFCAREASQIFGGLSYSRGGQGAKIERLYRDVRAYAIPGKFSKPSLPPSFLVPQHPLPAPLISNSNKRLTVSWQADRKR